MLRCRWRRPGGRRSIRKHFRQTRRGSRLRCRDAHRRFGPELCGKIADVQIKIFTRVDVRDLGDDRLADRRTRQLDVLHAHLIRHAITKTRLIARSGRRLLIFVLLVLRFHLGLFVLIGPGRNLRQIIAGLEFDEVHRNFLLIRQIVIALRARDFDDVPRPIGGMSDQQQGANRLLGALVIAAQIIFQVIVILPDALHFIVGDDRTQLLGLAVENVEQFRVGIDLSDHLLGKLPAGATEILGEKLSQKRHDSFLPARRIGLFAGNRPLEKFPLGPKFSHILLTDFGLSHPRNAHIAILR